MGSILADPGQWQCKRPQTRPSLRPAETAPCRGRAAYNGIGPEIQETGQGMAALDLARFTLPLQATSDVSDVDRFILPNPGPPGFGRRVGAASGDRRNYITVGGFCGMRRGPGSR